MGTLSMYTHKKNPNRAGQGIYRQKKIIQRVQILYVCSLFLYKKNRGGGDVSLSYRLTGSEADASVFALLYFYPIDFHFPS